LIGGRYRLRERLGHGGMSVVWRADDDVLGREVAVKVLAARLAAVPDVLPRIHAEARAAAGLRHAMIVEVYDYGEMPYGDSRVPYVVMELVDGRPLADLLSGGRLPWRLAVLVGAQVAAALAAAHARGVVHRDVKPGNVMVTSSGVKLVDFGISATVGEMDGADGEVLGTPAYLAPERIGGGPVRPATDVYALGLLLYLSLCGRQPWQASTVTQMLKAHWYLDPAPLPSVPGLPSSVVRLVRRCLAKNPGDRPTAAEVADVLGEIAGLPPATLLRNAAATTLPIGRPRTPQRRGAGRLPARLGALPGGRRTAVAAAGTVAVLATGAAGWIALGPRASTADAAVVPGCAVTYAVADSATTASTTVTILNTGRTLPAWRLTFPLPGNQRLIRGWSATWQQRGGTVQANGGSVAPGGSVTTRFETTPLGRAALPASFRLNGTPCRADTSVVLSSSTAPATPTRPPATPTAARHTSGSGNVHQASSKPKADPKPKHAPKPAKKPKPPKKP
jgi:serine/threonine-protein kinase